MESETPNSSNGFKIHSIITLITSTLVLGFLFTWDFLVFSTIWTLRVLIAIYAIVHLFSFLCGFLGEDENLRFRWNKQLKFTKKLKEYLKAFGVFVCSTLIFYALPVLLGAPLFSDYTKTLHFSVLLSTIITLPGILTWGGDELKWLRIVFGTGCQSWWESNWLRSCCFCLGGAWFSAFVIPLDWDRPWQVWPISCTYGCLLGYSCGLIYNLHGQRLGHGQNDDRKHV